MIDRAEGVHWLLFCVSTNCELLTLPVSLTVAVVVAFFICWAPFHAQRLLAVYARSNNSDSPVLLTVYKTLTYVSGVLYYMSTTVNPVLYHIMSHKFREAFKVRWHVNAEFHIH